MASFNHSFYERLKKYAKEVVYQWHITSVDPPDIVHEAWDFVSEDWDQNRRKILQVAGKYQAEQKNIFIGIKEHAGKIAPGAIKPICPTCSIELDKLNRCKNSQCENSIYAKAKRKLLLPENRAKQRKWDANYKAKNKSNPEYRKMRREQAKRWREKNKNNPIFIEKRRETKRKWRLKQNGSNNTHKAT